MIAQTVCSSDDLSDPRITNVQLFFQFAIVPPDGLRERALGRIDSGCSVTDQSDRYEGDGKRHRLIGADVVYSVNRWPNCQAKEGSPYTLAIIGLKDFCLRHGVRRICQKSTNVHWLDHPNRKYQGI